LIQESEVSRNGLKVLSRNKETVTKGIGKNGIIKCKGTVEYPFFVEGHQITIRGRVCKDDDMPTGKHVLIGNSHQLVRKTKIDFENLIYHTMADDGTHLQIPFSVGETQFTERKFSVFK